ncbi:hypothetical protein B0H16DRAFT_1817009 [Mycena metata]|uniref:Uncharacterized protein n=1 Tax=Mycena metata TaxID=1033252 RepID=A0AAD7H3W9_9AGAR|nr:hypothetical protein B0H16DRAFT_1817009 [Mycena metata]
MTPSSGVSRKYTTHRARGTEGVIQCILSRMAVKWASGTIGMWALSEKIALNTRAIFRTVVKKMVEGYPSNGYRGHRTLVGCINEWQLHCALGAHPHPVDPKLSPSPTPTQTPNGKNGRQVHPQLQADLKRHCMPILPSGSTYSDSASTLSTVSTSSTSTTTWTEVPTDAAYFALWRGRLVYEDWESVMVAFVSAEAQGLKPSVFFGADYQEAKSFAHGTYWIED